MRAIARKSYVQRKYLITDGLVVQNAKRLFMKWQRLGGELGRRIELAQVSAA